MEDEIPNPVVSTQSPESGTEFGGVDGLVPPLSVNEPTTYEASLIHRGAWRAARAAREDAARRVNG